MSHQRPWRARGESDDGRPGIIVVRIAFQHDAFESLLFAVAIGVGLTPEFLPMITSVTLAEGARRLAREGVIVPRMGVVPFETRPND